MSTKTSETVQILKVVMHGGYYDRACFDYTANCSVQPKLKCQKCTSFFHLTKLDIYVHISFLREVNYDLNLATTSENVTCYDKIDHLQFFYEIHVLGMGRRRIYCRVQRSKSQAQKGFLSRVMVKKLYTGHPCLIFRETERFVRT